MFLDEKKLGEALPTTDKFLTAEQLNIPAVLYDALLKTLALLESGEIKPLPDNIVNNKKFLWRDVSWTNPKQFFYMAFCEAQYDCGTAGCILGIAYTVGDDKALLQHRINGNYIPDLFMPEARHFKGAMFCRDPKKGAMALRNYFTTGNAQWDKVMESV